MGSNERATREQEEPHHPGARLARNTEGQSSLDQFNHVLLCPGLRPQGTQIYLAEDKGMKPEFMQLHKLGYNLFLKKKIKKLFSTPISQIFPRIKMLTVN